VNKVKKFFKRSKKIMAKYVEDFNEWALSMYDEYKRVFQTNSARWMVSHYSDKNSTTTTLIDLKKGKCGSAKASKKEYRVSVGIGVAWARLRGYEVPKERKKTMLKNLADYDKFHVVTLENMDLIKIGDIPKTKDVAVYDIKKDILIRINKDIMVYKIN
jgi:hypothetical protein